MKDLLAKQDWVRVLLVACFAAYLLQKIYVATDKLLEGEIGSIQVSLDSDKVTLPSVTFCPAYTAAKNRQNSENITFDSKNQLKLEDMLVSATQYIHTNA